MTRKERIEAVVGEAFSGLHNAPTIKWHGDEDTDYFYAELFVSRDMATFDFNNLTLLVFASHQYGVRACLSPHMRYIKLQLHPRRSRLDSEPIWSRHPTIEKAVESYRRHAKKEEEYREKA